jgi:hypothetical protein
MLVCVGFLVFILRSYDSSEKYGSDTSSAPDDRANYIYGPKTGNTNLRRHLHKIHGPEYDEVVLRNKWPYKLSTESRDASIQNPCDQRKRDVPSFSPATFLDHLVRFIAADDQVSPDDLVHSYSHKSSVDPCCRMPRVSKVVYGSSRDSRRR